MAADHREDSLDDPSQPPSDTNTVDLVISTYTATDPEERRVTLELMGNDADKFELANDTDETSGVSRVLSFKGSRTLRRWETATRTTYTR